jgi:hypothetical protein
MDKLPSNPRAIYMKSLKWRQKTTLPLQLKERYIPLRGNMVKTWIFLAGGHAFSAVCFLSTQAPQARRVPPRFEVTLRARIPSSPAEPPVLALWLNQGTRQFCGEPPQTPCTNFGRESLPCTGSCSRLLRAFRATMRPALDLVRPLVPSSQAYLSLHSSEAPQD